MEELKKLLKKMLRRLRSFHNEHAAHANYVMRELNTISARTNPILTISQMVEKNGQKLDELESMIAQVHRLLCNKPEWSQHDYGQTVGHGQTAGQTTGQTIQELRSLVVDKHKEENKDKLIHLLYRTLLKAHGTDRHNTDPTLNDGNWCAQCRALRMVEGIYSPDFLMTGESWGIR